MKAALLLAAAAATLGCSTLDRFDTKDGEAYCGNLVTGTPFREGFPDNDLRLRMTLDTDQLSSTPGTLTTSVSSEEPCTGQPILHAAPMRITEAMLHDPLSTFDFGMGRDHNFMAWVDSTCSGPMLAVVSLLRNDDVEVRLMKPPPAPAATATEPPQPGFALFPMTRRKDDCGF